jgi:energy-coupling factor transport system permease protein
MLSLLLIYAYATPGTAIWEVLAQFSPTYEGLNDGLLQLGRLVFALAGLSILLSMLPQQQLIGGLYTLAYPLRHIGLSRERIAVRLALTLRYADSAMLDTSTNWRNEIARLLEPTTTAPGHVELHVAPFSLRDGLLLAAGCTVLALVLL